MTAKIQPATLRPGDLAKRLKERMNGPKTTPAKPLEIGDTLPDGTVYVGISPTTGKQMAGLPHDLKGIWTEVALDAGKTSFLSYPAGTFRAPGLEETRVIVQINGNRIPGIDREERYVTDQCYYVDKSGCIGNPHHSAGRIRLVKDL